MKLRKIFPLVGIGVISVAGISTGVALALTSKNIINDTNVDAVYNSKLMSYAFNNLTSYDILNNPIMLSDYLYDYGVFGNINANPYKSVKVDTKINSDGNYNINKIEFISSNDDSAINVDCNLNTNVVEVTSIDNLDFSNLYNLFIRFNTISEAYQQCYNSTNSLLNLLTSNINNLNSDYIDSVFINFSNNFNNTIANTLAFNLTINLKNQYIYKDSNIINLKLETSILIDWNLAYNNATKYFNINSDGVITGITDLGLQQEFLVIPMQYNDENFNVNSITGIKSLLPNDSNSLDTSNIKAIILPNGIKTIGDNAFGGIISSDETNANLNQKAYVNLKWLNLPSSIQTIGNSAFANCRNLESLDFYNCQYLLTIGNSAFYYCEKFINVIMNDNIINIGDSSFDQSNNLRKLRISRKLNNIPDIAFASSDYLKNVTIPYGITSIGTDAFYGSGLEFVNIPYSVSNIGDCAFYNFLGKNIVFLDRGIVNGIQFGETLFGKSGYSNTNLNVYIFGEYNKGSQFWLSFWWYTINIYVNSKNSLNAIKGGGNNANDNYLFLMDNSNLPYPTINNVDQFVKYVQEHVNNLNDIKDIFYDSNYVYNLANEFDMFFNNSWISSFKLNGKIDNNYINNLIFTIILRNGLTYNINVPLLTPIYYPENYHNIIDNSGNVILNENIETELKTIIVDFFAQYASTYDNNNLAIVLGGEANLNTLYSLLNDVLTKYTNNYFEFNITNYNIRGAAKGWSNGINGKKNVNIMFSFNTNNIFVETNNNLNISTSTYNNINWIVFNDIPTNVPN